MPDSTFSYDTYLSPFTWRYGSEAMRQLWSQAHKRRLWRRVWVALATAQQRAGLVRADQVADLQGRKIRAVGMEATIMDVLGAAPVAISGAEQYMALKRGTVEGTDYPFYTIGNRFGCRGRIYGRYFFIFGFYHFIHGFLNIFRRINFLQFGANYFNAPVLRFIMQCFIKPSINLPSFTISRF